MPKVETHIPRLAWSGRVVAVQPRIRLMRSFDQRHHSYQGYVLRIDGTCGDHAGEFLIAVGKGAHEKHRFCVGMDLSGFSIPVDDPRLETAGFYKTSGIKICKEAETGTSGTPPFQGVPPRLETYRSRGHRRLDTRTYEKKCTTGTGSRPSATGRKVVSSTGNAQGARAERHVLHRRRLG